MLEAWGGRKQGDLQEVEPSGWFLGVCLPREMWDPGHPILEMRETSSAFMCSGHLGSLF